MQALCGRCTSRATLAREGQRLKPAEAFPDCRAFPSPARVHTCACTHARAHTHTHILSWIFSRGCLRSRHLRLCCQISRCYNGNTLTRVMPSAAPSILRRWPHLSLPTTRVIAILLRKVKKAAPGHPGGKGQSKNPVSVALTPELWSRARLLAHVMLPPGGQVDRGCR